MKGTSQMTIMSLYDIKANPIWKKAVLLLIIMYVVHAHDEMRDLDKQGNQL